MTIVTVFHEGDGQGIMGFSVEGHSGFAEKGEDIVCAAISVLTQSAVIGLQRHLGLKPEVEISEEEGWLSCRLPKEIDETTRLQSEAILQTMYLGVSDLAGQYPGFLKVQRRRCSR